MDTVSTTLLLLGVGALTVFVTWVRGRIFYWQLRGVPAASSVPFLGSYMPLFLRKLALPDFQKYLYTIDMESKYIGMMDFNTPSILVRDPELIKQLGVKQFEEFPDHKPVVGENTDSFFGKMMYFVTGSRWKEMNAVIRPAFTSSKIKFMSELVSETATDFVAYLLRHPEQTSSIEMKDAFTRFTADAIATAAFGLRVNCMEDKNNAFHTWGKRATDLSSSLVLSKIILFRVCPRLSRWWGMSLISEKSAKFFKDFVKENLASRKKLNIARPDVIHLLSQASKKNDGIVITVDDVIAQAFNSFFAGFDTSSTLMCYTAYELAVNPDIQDRLRDEIDRCLRDNRGIISYESLNDMKYLDAVVAEALRKYPPLPFTDRICRKSFELPPALPGIDSFTLQPNMVVYFPIYAIHHDPKYFPDPEKFDPERFNKVNKAKITPYTYIPFGVGLRVCLGDRFALMSIKLILAHLLAEFVLKPTSRTPIPLRFSKKSLTMGVEDGFWLELLPRKSCFN
ncbi:cytochrome P450 9e2-like [Neodiprion virginianus]|uniref:cytochrome P450 9e2-like n=1 Tax=Neodiprion virginianus TaxID=2961670 RepID=UPI001EE732A5|nr:cytochrome P450 9e2-like [Neodiprion virginianus]